nr:hypothetical protein [Alphaproteobacteria bacterium]
MSHDTHLATLSPVDKKYLHVCLEKIDKRQPLSSHDVKNGCQAIGKISKAINERILIEKFIKIFTTAFQLKPQEIDALKRMVQSSRTMGALTKDEEYLTIIKIAKALTHYHNQFRPMPHLNNFINQLSNDTAFKSILGIIKSANLSDALALELLKAQYKQNYVASSNPGELINQLTSKDKLSAIPTNAAKNIAQTILKDLNLSDDALRLELVRTQYQKKYAPSSVTDKLITAIESKTKLSALPDATFNNLTTHIGKKFTFSDANITKLQKLEKTGNKDLAKSLYNVFKDKSNVQYMPKTAKGVLQTIHNGMLKTGMEKYVATLDTLNVPPTVHARLYGYKNLLIDIEQGKKKPSVTDLENLNLLYNELKSLGKLDAMPNRTQAFLENYRLEQELKKNAPLNAQKLLEKLDRGEKLGVFQAFYLSSQLKENQRKLLTDKELRFSKGITAILKNLPQDVRDKAAEIKDLNRSKLLEAFEKIIEQIRAEQRTVNFSNRRFYVKETGIYTQLTSNYFELRFRDKDFGTTYKKAMKDAIRDSRCQNLADIAKNLKQFKLIPHRGTDFTGKNFETDGTVRYIKDSEINPTISKVLLISDIINLPKQNPAYKKDSKNPDESFYIYIPTRDITILEYNDDTDRMILTTIRHIPVKDENPNLLVAKGQILTNKHKIGTYKLPDGLATPKEHTHIEKRLVDIAKIRSKLNIDKQKIINAEITKYIAKENKTKFNERKRGEFKESEFIKSVNTMSSSAEKDFVGLFTASSNIANQIRAHAKKDWDERASRIIQANNAKTVDQIYDAIHDGILRDIATLKAMIDILLRMKLMLTQIGDLSDKLNQTIQKAQKTVLDLQDNFDK